MKDHSFNEAGHEVLLSTETIGGRVDELAKELNDFYGDERITVMALVNGALVFAADLVRRLEMPLCLDTFAMSSYDGQVSSGILDFRSRPKLEIAGRHILLVDDILDTGLTLSKVKAWMLEQGAASVKICVLLEKEIARRHEDVSADWAGFMVPDVYVYGYGLDKDEFYRNLPFIARIAQE